MSEDNEVVVGGADGGGVVTLDPVSLEDTILVDTNPNDQSTN